jgi:hypothetical protein
MLVQTIEAAPDFVFGSQGKINHTLELQFGNQRKLTQWCDVGAVEAITAPISITGSIDRSWREHADTPVVGFMVSDTVFTSK